MRRLTSLWGNLTTLFAIAGCYFLFWGNEKIGYLFGIAVAINSLLQVFFGKQNNLFTEKIQVVIAIFIYIIFDKSLLWSLSVVFCIGDLAILASGLLLYTLWFIRNQFGR